MPGVTARPRSPLTFTLPGCLWPLPAAVSEAEKAFLPGWHVTAVLLALLHSYASTLSSRLLQCNPDILVALQCRKH